MVYYLIHKVAVVGNDYDTALEVLQILLEHIQSDDVQVVGRLIEHEEVGITHQHRAQVKAAALSPTQFIDIAMLRFGSKQEMLQELRSRQLLSIPQFDHFGYILHDINHLHLFVKLETVLRVVAETDSFAHIHHSAVGFDLSHQYLDKSRFTRSVVPYNSHLLITGKDIGKIIQNLQVSVALEQMIGFEYLASDIRGLYFQFYVVIVETLLGNLLQFIEGIFTVSGFVSACLRHPAHPVEFRTIEVVGTFYFHAFSFDAFLTFLQIIAVVTFILINLLIVNFDNLRADTVEEITVVRHHQQAQVGATQVVFQPFGHVQVQMVGRLIEDQQIRFGDQGIG